MGKMKGIDTAFGFTRLCCHRRLEDVAAKKERRELPSLGNLQQRPAVTYLFDISLTLLRIAQPLS